MTASSSIQPHGVTVQTRGRIGHQRRGDSMESTDNILPLVYKSAIKKYLEMYR